MNDPHPSLTSADMAWLTKVARSLTSNWPDADDLVQETWVAARTSPPREGGLRRPWLTRVLHSFHLRSLRTRSRRTRREAVVSLPEAVPSTSELIERAELQERLARVLADLDEPYRTTLLLVVFEDYTTAMLAEHDGISVVNARRRLRKARELVRERLGREYGEDRDHWCALLLSLAQKPLPGEAVPGSPAAPAPGGQLVRWGSIGAAAGVTVVTLVAGALLLTDPEVEAGKLAPTEALRSADSGAGRPDGPDSVRTSESRRVPLFAEASAVTPPESDRTPGATEPTLLVRGRISVRDEDGSLHTPQGGELLFERPYERQIVPVVAGTFELGIRPGEGWTLVRNAWLDDRAALFEASLAVGPFHEDVEVLVEAAWLPGTRLVVVDAATARPLTGLTVVADPSDRARHGSPFAHPGRYDLDAALARNADSPVAIAPRTAYQNVYFVRAPGHAWTAVRVDHLRGGEQRVQLARGEASLTVHVEGIEGRRAHLHLSDPGGRATPLELELTGASTTLHHLRPGPLEVSLARVEGSATPHDLLLLEGPNEVRLELPQEDQAPPSPRVGLRTVVRLPQSWGDLRPSLHLSGPEPRVVEAAGRQAADHDATTEWHFACDDVPSGLYRFEVVPTGWTRDIEVGAGPNALHIDVPPPVRRTLVVQDAETGESLDRRTRGLQIRWRSSRSKSPVPREQVLFESLGTSWTITSAPVPLHVEVRGHAYVPRTLALSDVAGPARHLVRLHRHSGLYLELRDQGSRVPVDLEWMEALRLVPLDGGTGTIYTHAFDGVEMVHRVSAGGHFQLSLPEVPGYRPIDPLEVSLDPGQVERVIVELEPAP